MSAIDKAVAHFDALPSRIIEVPEWGDAGGPLLVHARPVTMAQKAAISKRADGDTIKTCVYAIITLAKDAGGEALFTLEDKHKLMHQVDGEVVVRLAGELLSAESVEDALGN